MQPAYTPPTIFGDQWKRAKRRIRGLRGSKRAQLYARVLDHLERGWKYVLPLAGVRAAVGNPAPQTAETAVLYLLDIGVLECFRSVANESAEVIYTIKGEDAPIDDLHADVDELHCNLHVTRLLRTKGLPPELRQLVQATSANLLPWIEEFHPLWQAMADYVEPRPPR